MPIIRSFPHYLGIYLVTKDRDGHELPKESFDQIFEKAQAWFKARFTGSSEKERQVPGITRGKGRFGSEKGLEMYDDLWELYVYCTDDEFEKCYESFIELAEEVQLQGRQESIFVVIDGKGHEVRKER